MQIFQCFPIEIKFQSGQNYLMLSIRVENKMYIVSNKNRQSYWLEYIIQKEKMFVKYWVEIKQKLLSNLECLLQI